MGLLVYVMRPFALDITAVDFALAAGHRFPTLRSIAVPRRTDGAGGFLLIRIRCKFRRSPSSRSLPIMFAGICAALIGANWCGNEIGVG
jgi:hypothetical protein